MSDALPITALIATICGWPAAKPALEHLVGQTIAAGGEVIVADGSGKTAPTEEEIAALGGPVTWLSKPGASVFQCVLRPTRVAWRTRCRDRGPLPCGPRLGRAAPPAHDRFPEAGVVGGAVLNGTDQKLVDWAAFFLTQGPFMPPLQNGLAERVSGPANCSYKRRVLERLGGDEEQGVIDFLELPEALEGERLAADDSIRVLHHQSQGILGTSWRFDNGRTIAGYRRREMERGDWLRIAGASVLPMYRAARACASSVTRNGLRGCGSGPRRRTFGSSTAPWPASCSVTWRPGDSPHRLY